jgi:hypothetical protein
MSFYFMPRLLVLLCLKQLSVNFHLNLFSNLLICGQQCLMLIVEFFTRLLRFRLDLTTTFIFLKYGFNFTEHVMKFISREVLLKGKSFVQFTSLY